MTKDFIKVDVSTTETKIFGKTKAHDKVNHVLSQSVAKAKLPKVIKDRFD